MTRGTLLLTDSLPLQIICQAAAAELLGCQEAFGSPLQDQDLGLVFQTRRSCCFVPSWISSRYSNDPRKPSRLLAAAQVFCGDVSVFLRDSCNKQVLGQLETQSTKSRKTNGAAGNCAKNGDNGGGKIELEC